MTRRVVITGLGVVSPCGLDVTTTWQAVKNGTSGIDTISRFDASAFASRIAGECTGFDAERHLRKREIRSTDRFIHLTIAAAEQVMAAVDLAPDAAIKERTGTFVGVGIGGLSYIESMAKVLAEHGPGRISPYFIPGTISNLAPGQVSMRHGLKGTSYASTSACASGAHAIGEAFRAISRGELDGCVAGGAEAAITPLGVGGFAALRSLSRRNDQPARASRPWDVDRDGFVISEGASLLFLEEREHAVKRSAPILAEIIGYGTSADAYHLTLPAPEGNGAARAMQHALADARLNPHQIDYVNAHATSTPAGDGLELRAIRSVFGTHAARGLWISSTKSITGHLLGAAPALEALLCVQALREDVVPPTINLDQVEPEFRDFDLVPHEARRRQLRYVLSNSFGFGGTNACLIFAQP